MVSSRTLLLASAILGVALFLATLAPTALAESQALVALKSTDITHIMSWWNGRRKSATAAAATLSWSSTLATEARTYALGQCSFVDKNGWVYDRYKPSVPSNRGLAIWTTRSNAGYASIDFSTVDSLAGLYIGGVYNHLQIQKTQVLDQYASKVACVFASCNAYFGTYWSIACLFNHRPVTWSHYGAPTYAPRSVSWPGSGTSKPLVMFSGLGTSGAGLWTRNRRVYSIPSSMAPPPKKRKIFLTAGNSNAIVRLDAFLDSAKGLTVVDYVKGGAGSGWISLDPVAYISTLGSPLTLTNGWAVYSSTYAAPNYATVGSTVFLSGLVKHSAVPRGKVLTTTPSTLTPEFDEVFPCLGNDAFSRVDVTRLGQVIPRTFSGTSGWISLENIHYRPKGTWWVNITQVHGWARYNTAYAPHSISIVGSQVVLRGLIRGGTSATLGVLPELYRPTARRLFIAACSTGPCRVDILPSGTVALVGKTPGTTSWPTWVSLSGITFTRSPSYIAY